MIKAEHCSVNIQITCLTQFFRLQLVSFAGYIKLINEQALFNGQIELLKKFPAIL